MSSITKKAFGSECNKVRMIKVDYKANTEVYMNKAKVFFYLQQSSERKIKSVCVLWYSLVIPSSGNLSSTSGE